MQRTYYREYLHIKEIGFMKGQCIRSTFYGSKTHQQKSVQIVIGTAMNFHRMTLTGSKLEYHKHLVARCCPAETAPVLLMSCLGAWLPPNRVRMEFWRMHSLELFSCYL